MCLAVPAEVVAVTGPDSAKVRLGGVVKAISTALVPGVQEGQFVVVHAGYALGLIDPSEAERTLALLAEAAHSQGAAV